MPRAFAEWPKKSELFAENDKEVEDRRMLLEQAFEYYLAKQETKSEADIPNYLIANSERLRQFLDDEDIQVLFNEYLENYTDDQIRNMIAFEAFLPFYREYFGISKN